MRVGYRRLRFVVLCLVAGVLFAALYYHWGVRKDSNPDQKLGRDVTFSSPIKLKPPQQSISPPSQSSEAHSAQPTAAEGKPLGPGDNPWKGLIVKSPHLPFKVLPVLPEPKYTHRKPAPEFEKPAHQKLEVKRTFGTGGKLVYPELYDDHPIDFDDVLVLNENGVDEEKLNVARVLQAQKSYRKIMKKL